jgi:hypothetical protein
LKKGLSIIKPIPVSQINGVVAGAVKPINDLPQRYPENTSGPNKKKDKVQGQCSK